MEKVKKYMKWVTLALPAVFLTSMFAPMEKPSGSKIRTLVIDAGHGGKDPGAHGKEAWEKNITLSIAKKLRDVLKQKMPDVKVVLTRDDDTFVELHNRAKTCSTADADFFVSIHCNANESSTPYGSETYIMGLHKEDANLDVVMRENKSILLEDDYKEEYEGFDPDNPLHYIMISNLANDYLIQSDRLASRVEKQLAVSRNSRGVKQAGYLVLWRAGRPAILIETGFISNPEEEKFLNSEDGQNFYANSIFKAIKDYNDTAE